jgi:hypothetical protein
MRAGDELGYFAFGGSTIVTVFEHGRVEFDQDLVATSSKQTETLISMGMKRVISVCLCLSFFFPSLIRMALQGIVSEWLVTNIYL